ncbi:MAG: hypothetical protein U5N56_09875 [Candidatus Marinimicrobia bacterium]|nr:hypothetical protein [Candidatus Neomarinimicrobiota bacterium]
MHPECTFLVAECIGFAGDNTGYRHRLTLQRRIAAGIGGVLDVANAGRK